MWNTRYKQIERTTLYLPLINGGLMVPNIKLKCNSFYLLHVSKLINIHVLREKSLASSEIFHWFIETIPM